MTILIVLMALMIVLAGVATWYGLEYLLEARKSTGPVMLRYVLSEDQRRSLVSFIQVAHVLIPLFVPHNLIM